MENNINCASKYDSIYRSVSLRDWFMDKVRQFCRYMLREELRQLRIDVELERYHKNRYKELAISSYQESHNWTGGVLY